MYFNARVSKEYEQKINFIKNYYLENLNKEINYRQILEMGLDLLIDKIDDKSNEQQALLESYNDELLRNLVALFDSKVSKSNEFDNAQNIPNNILTTDGFNLMMVELFKKVEYSIQLNSMLIKLKALNEDEIKALFRISNPHDMNLQKIYEMDNALVKNAKINANDDIGAYFRKREKILNDDSTNI